MADEKHGIEIEIDSRPASAGEDRIIRSLDNIKKKVDELSKQGAAASKRTTDGNNKAGESARQYGQKATDAFNKATTGIDRHIAAIARTKPSLIDLEATMNRIGRARTFEPQTRSANAFASSLTTVRNLLVGIGAVAVGREIAQTAVQFKGFEQALRIVTGSSAGASKELAFAEQVAEKLGFRVRDITQGYVGFAAAARGTALEGEGSRKVFEAITRASAAYGLSNEQLKGSLLAVQQMIGKGTVSAEELRGQLGERLPGAVQIAARAMNMTTAQLFKMMEQGQLVSDQFLDRFADQLNREIPAGAKSANSAFNSFLSQLDRAKIALADSGLFEGMAAGAKALADVMQQLASDGTFDAIGGAIGGFMKLLADNIGLLKLAALAFGIWFAAMKIAPIVAIVSEMVAMNLALGASSTAMAAAGAGAKVLQGAWIALTGTMGLLTGGLTLVTAAIYGLWQEGQNAQQVLDGLDQSGVSAAQGLADLQEKARASGIEVTGLSSAANAGDPLIRMIAGAYNIAADAAGRLAKNARLAAISVAQGKIAELKTKKRELALPGGTGLGMNPIRGAAALWGELGFGPSVADRAAGMSQADQQIAIYQDQIKLLNQLPDSAFDEKPRSPYVAPAGKPTGRARSGGKSEAEQEAERQKQLAEQRAKAEADFWQGLQNNIDASKQMADQADNYNKYLELARILSDGQVVNADKLTQAQRERIDLALQQEGNEKSITGYHTRINDLMGEQNRLETEAQILSKGTNEEIDDRIELQRRMYGHQQDALKNGANLEDTMVKLTLAELEIHEKTNIELERKNALIRQGNDLVDQLVATADPKLGLQREYARNRDLVNNSTRPQAEKDAALAQLAKEFHDNMAEINDRWRRDMLDSVDDIADAFGGRFGSLVGNLGEGIVNFLEMGKSGYESGSIGRTSNSPVARIGTGLSDISKKLGDTFGGKSGTFFKGLSSGLSKFADGASMGGNIAGIAKAIGIKKFSSTGAQIGGGIGNMFGPIGGMVGSVLGGIVGGLFKKSKQGAVSLGGAANGQAILGATSGNSQSMIKAASGAGKGVIDTLNNIARSLGGSVGSFGNITIGQNDGEWRVNTTGTSTKVKKGAKDFGKEGEADAIFYAVQEAVRRGAIQGLSEATNRVIKGAGSNLEAAVNAAQVYEDLMRQARSLADPIKGAFDELNRGFKQTIDQLKAVGYTEADLAGLQVLYSNQQKQLLEEMTDGYRQLLKDMTKGPNSGKTIFAQFNDALEDFRKLQSSGNFTQDQFTEAGQSVFDLARQVYGSATPEFEAIKAELVKATQDALAQVESAAKAASESSEVKASIDAAAAAAAAQRDTTNLYLGQIAESLSGGTLRTPSVRYANERMNY